MASIEVLALGMSRTGTATMKEALRILGHNLVHHAYELYVHPEQCDQWLAAWEAKVDESNSFDRQEWDRLLASYTAVTDMPSACFAEELIHLYPEAKVVLVLREEQAWLRSFTTGVIDTYFDNARVTNIISLLDPQLMKPVHTLWARLLASATGFLRGTTREEVSSNALDVYRKHNATVRHATEPSRLLEFNLKDGWEPLCTFLGAEIPNVPFPRVNEGDAVKQVVSDFVQRSMFRALRNIAIAVVGTGLGIRYLL